MNPPPQRPHDTVREPAKGPCSTGLNVTALTHATTLVRQRETPQARFSRSAGRVDPISAASRVFG